MTQYTLFLVPFLFFVLSPPVDAADPIERPTKGRQYEPLRVRFSENLGFVNPFDLETNRVELHIIQPDFTRRVLSFFYDGVNVKRLEQWEARFTPKQPGRHRFTVVVRDSVTSRFELNVEPNKEKRQGGLTLADRHGTFRYETGEAFRGIGLNVCWTDDYEHYFRKMQAAGMNVTRIWMCPWNLSFEWAETGLGRYNLESARRLDAVLQLADTYGIYVILCMDYHGIAPKGMGFFRENRWMVNPYNASNGGPCADATEFFTSLEAKMYSRKKYNYIVSRYGHSSRVATWEFFNEADLMAGKAIPVNRWHVEMAEYVKSIDVHQRLVSSSGTRGSVEKLVDAFRSPAMDFVMYHNYNMHDVAGYVTDLHDVALEFYEKPFVMGEFGVEFRGADRTVKADPNNVGLHNGIWAGWFSETPVIPLSWWWDNYIEPLNLWHKFGDLARFAEKLSFESAHLTFTGLPAGHLTTNPEDSSPCMVRAIYTGDQCALWLKNNVYAWSLLSEGTEPKPVETFTQIVPNLVPGRYTITWYDPQAGNFTGTPGEGSVGPDGNLSLSVPSFSKDLACLIQRQR